MGTDTKIPARWGGQEKPANMPIEDWYRILGNDMANRYRNQTNRLQKILNEYQAKYAMLKHENNKLRRRLYQKEGKGAIAEALREDSGDPECETPPLHERR